MVSTARWRFVVLIPEGGVVDEATAIQAVCCPDFICEERLEVSGECQYPRRVVVVVVVE